MIKINSNEDGYEKFGSKPVLVRCAGFIYDYEVRFKDTGHATWRVLGLGYELTSVASFWNSNWQIIDWFEEDDSGCKSDHEWRMQGLIDFNGLADRICSKCAAIVTKEDIRQYFSSNPNDGTGLITDVLEWKRGYEDAVKKHSCSSEEAVQSKVNNDAELLDAARKWDLEKSYEANVDRIVPIICYGGPEPEVLFATKCECGSEAVSGVNAAHSSWCPKHS